jgi:lysophospholipase L1-like esterase
MKEIPRVMRQLALSVNLLSASCSSVHGGFISQSEWSGSERSKMVWHDPMESEEAAYTQFASYEALPVLHQAAVETMRENPTITVLGDSITYLGFGKAFRQLASLEGLSDVTAIGYGGYGTSMILEGFDAPKPKDRVYMGTPEILVIQLGANDVWRSSHTPTEFAQNVADIIAYAREKNPTVHVIVMPVYPMDTNNDGVLDAESRRLEVNEKYESMARETSTLQSPVVYIKEGAGPGEYFDTTDGIHPTFEKATQMAYKPLEIILRWIGKEV